MPPEKATESRFLALPCSDELLNEIDNFRYSARIPTRAAAMRKLLADGLAANRAVWVETPSTA